MAEDLNEEFQKIVVAQKVIDTVLEFQSQMNRVAQGQPLLRKRTNTAGVENKPKPPVNE